MGGIHDSNTVLLTEHLRHTPISLMDDIINSVNEIGYKAVDAVEKGLSGASPEVLGFAGQDEFETGSEIERATLESKVKDEIENGVHQLETLLEATLDKNFDKMEVFALRSIIAVPSDLGDWIRLRHYEGLNFDRQSDAPTTESINLQRRKFQEAHRLNRILVSEVNKNAAMIAHLRSLCALSPPTKLEADSASAKSSTPYPTFGFLQHRGQLADGTGNKPLETTTEFALSQLPSLKALLAQLRPQMKQLAEGSRPKDVNLAEDKSDKTWRKERLEYVESQTRRHLEGLSGLELGQHGEVRDGEWQGEGRSLAKGEVADLERVVEMVGGGETDQSG